MSEDVKEQTSANSGDVWKQWQDAWRSYADMSASMWSKTMSASKETGNLYSVWSKNMTEAQEQFKAGLPSMLHAAEAWKMWLDVTGDIWKKAAASSSDTLGLATRWLEMMEQVRAKLQAGESVPTDPFTFFKLWYDATSDILAKNVGDMIGSDAFMQANSRFLESYLRAVRTFREASEDYFHNLQLATRSDIARVAQLIVALEEKVDTMDDTLENVEDKFTQFSQNNVQAATATAITSLEQRLARVESKLDTLLASLEKMQAGEHSNKPTANGNNASVTSPAAGATATRRKAATHKPTA